jgi:hypothetical protein
VRRKLNTCSTRRRSSLSSMVVLVSRTISVLSRKPRDLDIAAYVAAIAVREKEWAILTGVYPATICLMHAVSLPAEFRKFCVGSFIVGIVARCWSRAHLAGVATIVCRIRHACGRGAFCTCDVNMFHLRQINLNRGSSNLCPQGLEF